MRKVVLIVCSLLIMASLVVTNVEAFPYITVEGYVDAGTYTDNLDGTTTFSQIDYTFLVTGDGGSGAEMDGLSLEFEFDVFNSMGTISGIDPGDWTTNTISDLSVSIYQLANAVTTTIDVGDSLTFSMLDVIVYTDALSDASFWQEGQIWSQSFTAYDTLDGSDGGSTSPVPEPGTLLLLGSGLIGVAAYARRRKA